MKVQIIMQGWLNDSSEVERLDTEAVIVSLQPSEVLKALARHYGCDDLGYDVIEHRLYRPRGGTAEVLHFNMVCPYDGSISQVMVIHQDEEG